ncbi:uncharacterized protein MYCFIDRAFT_171579 [Pseudocercospora fijiensis CIRAD86]|uniref:Uncharacterized protein n=1 Tax=Pseudocercospora fijiensis (strain CIRAD86) TaxID=383855 RepID=M3B8R0_PSEFD|nr:uncharacterized protein MYCFIDRAFT_171579 [Pseudocercospora fijiensis CIRAD86]EME85693.1 hypothetical protein MYCFIDRAFT_171579 [Pseudocercospora fijiensis CIRAD86]
MLVNSAFSDRGGQGRRPEARNQDILKHGRQQQQQDIHFTVHNSNHFNWETEFMDLEGQSSNFVLTRASTSVTNAEVLFPRQIDLRVITGKAGKGFHYAALMARDTSSPDINVQDIGYKILAQGPPESSRRASVMKLLDDVEKPTLPASILYESRNRAICFACQNNGLKSDCPEVSSLVDFMKNACIKATSGKYTEDIGSKSGQNPDFKPFFLA